MRRAERFQKVIEWFVKEMPQPQTELKYEDPYQLTIAVILSAQCTDKRVNLITPKLFDRFPTFSSMASSSIEEIYSYIKSCSYPNSKSRYLYLLSKELVENYNSQLPKESGELEKLPGIGRKTANVLSSILYDNPVIAVDTHVFRVARRIGLSNGTTPKKVEADLTRHIPTELRAISHHWLILHGRYVCVARNPKCDQCGLSQFCRYRQKIGGGDL
ncbi:MAG: endonuclease III [Bacteroidales bacterium]